jgi:FAD/FMN-containing dehydrogenase
MSGIRCRSIIKNATTAWCSKRHVKQRNTHIVVFGTHRDRHFGSYPFHKNSYHGYLTMTSLSTASSLSYASYFTTIKKRFATQNTNDGNDNDNDNSVIASKEFSHIENPIADDAENFLLLMDSRPGSLLTTFKTMSINNDDDDDDDDDNDDTTTHNDDDDEDYRETPSLEKYNVDWTGHYRGSSSIVVRPKSTKEVSRILSYCHKRRIGVVPQGGNTGLVGGSVGIGGEVILSLEKMNNFECYDKKDGSIIRADAGCILEDLQNYAAKNGNLVPVDLGAKGSCQIGGNVSTNAGGVYYYRYGSLHANVLGLEVVTPTGDVLNLGYDPVSHLKDNTGYHLKHLFIGGEGTLGVVTKVSLQCPPLPVSRGAMWLTCTSLSDVVRVLTLARTDHLNEILAAFEFMDRDVLELVRAAYPSIRFPLDIGNVTPATTINNDNIIDPYSILIETHGSDNNHDREKLESFFESIMEEGLVVDGVMAQNLGQIEDFWKIRELCNPATAATGKCNDRTMTESFEIDIISIHLTLSF